MIRFVGLAAFFALASAGAMAAMSPPPAPPTPTPEPRLTGGFGKTPIPSQPRRRVEKKGALRITNDSLVTETDKGKVSTSDVRPATPAPTTTAAASGATPGSAATETTPTAENGEAYWRGEGRRLRERIAALKAAVARLQEETRRLETDFYSWDDGSYRDRVIKPAWDKAREELATAQRELPLAERDLADLPDRARRAGALPGWLRE